MKDRALAVVNLYGIVSEASPACAAVIIAREAGFDRGTALDLVAQLSLFDDQQRIFRPRFWSAVTTMLGGAS